MNTSGKPYAIVTYHDGFNFGAYLQVFALQKILNSHGLSAQVINYKNQKHWLNEYKSLLWTKRPSLFVKNLLKWWAFKKAHKLISMSEFSFHSQNFSGDLYRAVVYGSDEIWNYSNPLLGMDSFYFGSGMTGVKKVSYAPSCGNLPYNTSVPDNIVKLWKSFDAISVRDVNSQSILSQYLDVPPPIVLDPTFLYDFNEDIRPCKERDFVLVYTTGLSKLEERSVRAFANQKGMRLISVGYGNAFCDKSIIGIGPFEFLGYYAAADYVVTSMFHGTIFALKAKKNFAVLVDPYRTNKLAYILEKLNIKDRVTDAEGLMGVMQNPIDYLFIQKTLSQEVNNSLKYLFDALGDR